MARSPHLLAAAYLILIQNNQVLLQRRFQTGWMDGMYSLPAGHIENEESATNALLREVKEEIGIELKKEDISVAHVIHRFVDTQHQYIDFFYTATNWEGQPSICEPEKCDSLEWFSITDLPSQETIPYIREVLQNIQKGVLYSEHGWENNFPPETLEGKSFS